MVVSESNIILNHFAILNSNHLLIVFKNLRFDNLVSRFIILAFNARLQGH